MLAVFNDGVMELLTQSGHTATYSDHLVGVGEQRLRHGETERLSRPDGAGVRSGIWFCNDKSARIKPVAPSLKYWTMAGKPLASGGASLLR
jgi:hypothetical protein